MKKILHQAYLLVTPREDSRRGSRLFSSFIMVLILANVAAVVLCSFKDLYERYAGWFDGFEVFSVVIFTVEYLVRLVTARELFPQARFPRLKYLFSFYSLIDLAAIVPFYIPLLVAVDLRFLRLLRLFRLLRIFKFTRYFQAFGIIGRVLKKEKQALAASFCLLSLLLLMASCAMYAAESEAQPDKFPNIIATLWWAVVTLTTVGYGDVYPVTALGKFLSGAISIIGIGVVALPTGIISSGFISEFSKSKKEKSTRCPHCGKEIDHQE